VLLVSPWYAPEPEGRVAPLAEALVARGHEVRVLTGFPHLGTGKVYDGYTMRWRQRETIRGVDVVRLPLFPDHSSSVVKRSTNYLSFNASLVGLGTWMLRKADVIWGYTALVGVPAMWFRQLLGAPVVLDIPDLWPEALFESGMVPQGPMVDLLGKVSDGMFRQADFLTLWNPGFQGRLEQRGVPSGRMRIIENWCDAELFRPVDPEPELAERFGLGGRFNVMFAGNMGFAQGLETVLDAAALLQGQGNDDVQFVLVGDGACYDDLRAQAEAEGLDNVRFLGRHPKDLMPRLFAHADALLVHLRDRDLFSITIPGKTQAYLACARPIVMAVKGDGTDLVDATGVGVTCPPEDAAALAEAVLKLRAMSPEERQAMGRKGRALFEERFTQEGLLGRMEQTLVEVAERGRLS